MEQVGFHYVTYHVLDSIIFGGASISKNGAFTRKGLAHNKDTYHLISGNNKWVIISGRVDCGSNRGRMKKKKKKVKFEKVGIEDNI